MLGLPCGSAGKESPCNAGDLGSILGLGRDSLSWRRERLPTPVFCPGEFHGLYSPWGLKESDTTERLTRHFTSLGVSRGWAGEGGGSLGASPTLPVVSRAGACTVPAFAPNTIFAPGSS